LALDRVRRRVADDLSRPALDRARLTAAVIRLLDIGHIRVGNAEYAKENGSYGATTLEDRHVVIEGGALRLRFKAKSGKLMRRKIPDAQLVRIVRRCHELPGHTLFCYLDEQGEPRPVRSDDVNAYLKDIAGDDFTAKHFRTWSGSVIAFETMAEIMRQNRKPTIKEVSEVVAIALGNTPAICRSSYIHPALTDRLKSGDVTEKDIRDWPRRTKFLSRGERAFIRFLEDL
jgi:DNA topoisomerase-1